MMKRTHTAGWTVECRTNDSSLVSSRHFIAIAIGLLTVASPLALAGPVPPDYDWQWATIGDPGNAAHTRTTAPDAGTQVGAVNYKYRMAKTEVTASQWAEFATAYAPHVPNWITHQSGLTGRFGRRRENPDGSVYYTPRSGADNRAQEIGWEFALRFCNWLHNDKGTERSDFETGAYDLRRSWSYDTGSFDGIIDYNRNPNARFWLPTADEWVKAMHYDPNRHGAGQGGYWLYPDGSDTPLIPGYPEDGGETDAGLDSGEPGAHYVDVGSYTNVMSPWGLFDGSGGSSELVFEPTGPWDYLVLSTYGSHRFGYSPDYWDHIDISGVALPGGIEGFRLASVIPAPSNTMCCGVMIVLGTFHRRRSTEWHGQ